LSEFVKLGTVFKARNDALLGDNRELWHLHCAKFLRGQEDSVPDGKFLWRAPVSQYSSMAPVN